MSSAFRNFILTLVLMLCVLGYAAYKLVPKLEDTVIKPIFNETSGEVSEASEQETSDTSDSSESQDVSTPEQNEPDTVLDVLLIAKNDEGHACAVLYIRASKQSNTYLICSLPVDMYLDNGGRNVPLYDLIGSQTTEYAIKKISALVGRDIKNYAVIDTAAFVKLASVTDSLSVELPYQVKFVNPVYSFIPESQRQEEHYIKLQAGNVVLSEANAAGIFNSKRDEDITDYSFQQSMALSLVKQICSDTSFVTDLVAQKKLHALLETDLSYNDFADMSRLIFSYATSKQTMLTYPTTKNYAADGAYVPDWASAINAIDSACS